MLGLKSLGLCCCGYIRFASQIDAAFLQGAYVNIDDFKSRVRVLASQFSPSYDVKTVFNQDSI